MGDRIAVAGVGRLGSCLVRALARAGQRVTALASATPMAARALDAELALGAMIVTVSELPRHVDLIFLCVPDDQIAVLAAELALGPEHALVHCSGALDLTPLSAAEAGGASVGAFHPLQSFARGATPERFAGIGIGVDAVASQRADAQRAPLEAQPGLHDRLWRLAELLGATPFSLRGVDRARYHAAAVFASNYLVALHAAAARIWQSAGLPAESARPLLAALTRGAAQNVATDELAAALTGPIARGDAHTVQRHLLALAADPASLALYRALARELLALPLALPPAAHAALSGLTGATGAAPLPLEPGEAADPERVL